jgi:hypothetical protein
LCDADAYADAYAIVLDAHGNIAWGHSDIGRDPIVELVGSAGDVVA